MEDIEAFLAVIEAGSQTAAARRLGRSLQSVNRSSAALERSVGVELVRRTTRQSLPFVRDRFRLGFLDPLALVEATPTFYEYPNCDRDPLPRWSFGRVTLLGDAAHPMYPTGSNGASQSIVDAQCLARCLVATPSVSQALAAYDAERRPATAKVVAANRVGGPEGVIDVMEERAPDGFDAIASHAEREAIVRGYASMAGYAREQVNRQRGDKRRRR